MNIKNHIYYKMLGIMDGMNEEKASQITQSGNYSSYEKSLGIEPYIAKMINLLNKHIFQNTKISASDLKDLDSLTYAQLNSEMIRAWISNKEAFSNALLNVLKEFQNDFVKTHKFTGDSKYSKFFKYGVDFNNLIYEDAQFLATFYAVVTDRLYTMFNSPCHFAGFGEMVELSDDFKKMIQAQVKKKEISIDINKIVREYSHISKSKYEAMGYIVHETDGGVPVRIGVDDAVNITFDQQDKEVVIIPATIDGKKIKTISEIHPPMPFQEFEKPRVAVILGDVEDVDNFLNCAPNLEKLYLFGEIQNISTSFIGSDVTAVDGNGNYLRTQNNNHYALMNTTRNCGETFDVHPETKLISTQSFNKNTKVKTVNLRNVENISACAFEGSSIEEIDMSNISVLHRGDFAFCENLKRVNFGNKIESIPEGCFIECNSLEEVYLPEQITGIHANAFCKCPSLKKAVIAGDVFAVTDHLSNMFSSCSPDLVIYCKDYLIKAEQFFIKWIEDENDIPDIKVYNISDLNNPNAKCAIISKSPKNISTDEEDGPDDIVSYGDDPNEKYSYVSCSDDYNKETFTCLKEYNGYPVKLISYAFGENEKIKKVHFKNDISFDEECFYDTPNLEEIIVDGDVVKVDCNAFKESDKLFTIYNGVRYIKVNDNPYYICSELVDKNAENITLHDDCVVVQDRAFYETNIKHINFNNAKYIGSDTIAYCGNLETVEMSDKVKSIGRSYRFTMDCNKLKTIKIGNKIKTVNDSSDDLDLELN